MSERTEEEGREMPSEEAEEQQTETTAGEEAEAEGATHFSNLLLGAGLVSLCMSVAAGIMMMVENPLPGIGAGIAILLVFAGVGMGLQSGLPPDETYWQTTRLKVVCYVLYIAAVIGAVFAALSYYPYQRYRVGWFMVAVPPLLPIAWFAYGVYRQWGAVRLVGWTACLAAVVFYFLPLPFHGGIGYQLLQDRCTAGWRRAKTQKIYMLEGEQVKLRFCPVHSDAKPEITQPAGQASPPTIAGIPEVHQNAISPIIVHAIGIAGGILLAGVALLFGRSIYRSRTVPTFGAIVLAAVVIGLSSFWF